MRITNVYTRTGDNGTTRLVGGAKIAKSDQRIEAFGDVDELNASLGIAHCKILAMKTEYPDLEPCSAVLLRIQNDLFSIGGDLATRPEDRWESMVRISQDEVDWLESQCDLYNDQLEPLKEFILPGGGEASCALHLARTICRRAERRIVLLEDAAPGSADRVLPYINRLSDLLFVLARWTARTMGQSETMWKRRS